MNKIILSVISSLLLTNMLFTTYKPTNNPLKVIGETLNENSKYRFETIITEEKLSTFSVSTKSGTKTVNLYNGDTILWSISVTGTFTYGNGTSKATSAKVTTNVFSSAWKITDSSSSYSGNSAKATAVAKRYLLGIPLETITKNVELICDSSGNLY